MISVFRLLAEIIPRADKVRAALVFFLMLINAALEVVSIGLVLPFIAVFTADAPTEKYPPIGRMADYFGVAEKNDLILLCCAIFVGVIAVKSVFTFLAHTAVYRFNWLAQHRLAVDLLGRYLHSDYVRSRQVNSAEIINLLRQSVGFVYGGFVMPMTVALADSLMIIATAGIVLVVEPLATLAAAVTIGIPALFLHYFLQPRLERLGQARERHNTQTLRALNEALGALKEATVLRKKGFFLDRYAEQDIAFNRIYIRSMTLNQIPRAILETSAIASVFVVLYAMLESNDSREEALAVIALFAAATLRVLPAALRIIQALNQARFAKGGIETVSAALRQYPDAAPAAAPAAPLNPVEEIAFDGVSYAYPDGTEVLNDVTLTLRRGEMIGVVGPSGTGKTTFVDLLMGLLRPTAGRITADGRDISPLGGAWLAHFGYVAQHVFLTDDTVRHNVALGISDCEIDGDAVLRALRDAQLNDFADAGNARAETLVGERGSRLSGGQLQRIGIARALYHNPDVLILDEPTSALNVELEREILELIRDMKKNKTVIIISHREKMLEYCDRVVRIDGGKIVDAAAEMHQ